MPHRIVFPEPNRVELSPIDQEVLQDGAIRIRTTVSLISPGTELRCMTGEFAKGTHWDNWVKYPMPAGYCILGEVVESRSDEFSFGERVFTKRPHADEVTVAASKAVRIPEGVSDDDAVWGALAMIGAMAPRAARMRLEDDVLIIGAGPIGQMAARWSLAAGARVLMLDPLEARRGFAERAGAFFATGRSDAANAIAVQHFGLEPRVVIDATGFPAVLQGALGAAARFGTVVVLGDVGDPSEQRLTSDVISRGVSVVGAHMGHEDAANGWTERSIHAKFHDLLRTGRFSLDGLITHRFKPSQAWDAYEMLNQRNPDAMGVVFDWR